MGEHEARHAIGERRLADAGRTADQPGMRHAPAAIGVEQRALGLGVAEQAGVVARVRNLDRRRRLAALTSRALDSIGAVAGSSRAFTTSQTISATSERGAVASIDDASLRLALGHEHEIGLAQLLVELERLALEPVDLRPRRAAWPRARARSRPAHRG